MTHNEILVSLGRLTYRIIAMTRFRYRATDESGLKVEGDLSAPSIDVARQELAHRGWHVIELTAVEPAAPSSARPDLPFEKLSGADAELLAGQMANVTGAGLPLSAGLRALSEEVPSFRVRRWLLAISERLDRGQSLGSVAREAEGSWPRYFLAMLFAGQRTGKLPTLLNECVVHLRTTAEVQSNRAWPDLPCGQEICARCRPGP